MVYESLVEFFCKNAYFVSNKNDFVHFAHFLVRIIGFDAAFGIFIHVFLFRDETETCFLT